jgi:beta-1,4-N-acetylglucosaminyltransferase
MRLPWRAMMSDIGRTQPQPRLRVLFACSAGGHLAQLLQLEPWYRGHDVQWVTFELPDAVGLIPEEQQVWAYHPTTRNLKNLVRNAVLAFRQLRSTRPQVIVSSGAAIAVPFFWMGRMFGAKTVYVEVIDRIDTRTLTARLVWPVTDLFVAQDESQL